MIRWEMLEIVERNGTLIEANLLRPMGQAGDGGDARPLPFEPQQDANQLICAALFDGYEPLSQSVFVLPDGTIEKHWLFRMQVVS